MNTESHNFACPNPSCGKNFATPLKAKNFSSRGAKPYDACPYCLTEIPVATISATTEEEQKQEIELPKIKKETSPLTEEKPDHTSPKVQGCAHHLGYLSKRSPKEKIPESCMMCEKIVQCMLKGVTG
jgi:hypothetical protein